MDRSVHIFGRGRAELRGRGPFYMIHSTSSRSTLDRLRIDNQTEGNSFTLRVSGGHLRLQGCDVSSRRAENGYPALYASGASTLADALGCTFRSGAGDGIWLDDGASGRVEGCNIRGCSRNGICLDGAGTAPLLSCNTIRDFKRGIVILPSLDPSWPLGKGNVFINCADGDVVDHRGPPLGPGPGN